MDTNKANEIAAAYWPHYPAQNELYVTADEQVFFEEHQAQQHANTLAEKEVYKAERNAGEVAVAETAETLEPEAAAEVSTDPEPTKNPEPEEAPDAEAEGTKGKKKK